MIQNQEASAHLWARRLCVIAVSASLATAVGLPSSSGATQPAERPSSNTVQIELLVAGMNLIEGDIHTPPAWPSEGPLSDGDDAASNVGGKVVVTVPADANGKERHLHILREIDKEQAKAEARAKKSGDITTSVAVVDERWGSCGYSYVELDQAWAGRFTAGGGSNINRPGYSYRINVRVWDPDWLDTFERNFPETGNLNGSRYATVYGNDNHPESDDYRASLSRGDVYVGGNVWCSTVGPVVQKYLRR